MSKNPMALRIGTGALRFSFCSPKNSTTNPARGLISRGNEWSLHGDEAGYGTMLADNVHCRISLLEEIENFRRQRYAENHQPNTLKGAGGMFYAFGSSDGVCFRINNPG
jgi:hypothetical protein